MDRFVRTLFLLILAAGVHPVHAQPMPPQGRQPRMEGRQPLALQAVVFRSADSVGQHVVLQYRVDGSFLVPVKKQLPNGASHFRGTGEISVEITSAENVPAAREFRKLDVITAAEPVEGAVRRDFEGAFAFDLPPGEYRCLFQAEDKESGRSLKDDRCRFSVYAHRDSTLIVGTPFLYSSPDSVPAPARITAMNYGAGLMLNSRGGVLMQIFKPAADSALSLKWSIEPASPPQVARGQGYSGTRASFLSGIPSLVQSDSAVVYAVSGGRNSVTAAVPLPLERLFPGMYRMKFQVSQAGLTRTRELLVPVVWPSMPSSLAMPELAIDALQHIAPKSTIDSLQSLPAEQQPDALRQYWRTLDPDTNTAYNERMAEYYRRVDQAIRKFSPAEGMEGYKTDRGRIYILYGSPASTDRVLLPAKPPMEVWKYPNLKRKYIFSDQKKNGNFVLIDVQTL